PRRADSRVALVRGIVMELFGLAGAALLIVGVLVLLSVVVWIWALIDAALGHVAKDKVEGAYNRAEHMAVRREIFDEWAELLAST
ncbi:MAG: hypothetical protein ACK40O_13350, partial [Allosphingosinicella sp.]